MAADLYKIQDDQRFPEIRIDKREFVYKSMLISAPQDYKSEYSLCSEYHTGIRR